MSSQVDATVSTCRVRDGTHLPQLPDAVDATGAVKPMRRFLASWIAGTRLTEEPTGEPRPGLGHIG